MPEYVFNSDGIPPQYGVGSNLPVGKHPVQIVKVELSPNAAGTGGYMALTLEAIDGPSKGVQHVDRLNLYHSNPVTVEIANKQLSAYTHVTGIYRFQRTEELHNKPFVVDIGPQKDRPEYTEVKRLYDINGNEPGHAGAGQQVNQGGQGGGAGGPPAGFGTAGGAGGFGGGQNNQGGGQGGAGAWGAGGGQQGGQGGQGGNGAQAGGAGGSWGQGGGQQGGQAGGSAPWGQR